MTGEQSQPPSDVLLVLGVNVCGLADVIYNCYASAAQRSRLHLAFLHLHPVTILGGVAEIGELHPEEWKIALRESSAPIFDERLESLSIDIALCAAGFGFALIPQSAFDGVLHERRYHSVVERGGFMRVARSEWRGRASCFTAALFPPFEVLLIPAEVSRIYGVLPKSEKRRKTRVDRQRRAADPGCDRRTSPARMNQPHRRFQILVQLPAEVVEHCRKIFRGL